MSTIFDPDSEPPTPAQIIGAWCVLALCVVGFGVLIWAALNH